MQLNLRPEDKPPELQRLHKIIVSFIAWRNQAKGLPATTKTWSNFIFH